MMVTESWNNDCTLWASPMRHFQITSFFSSSPGDWLSQSSWTYFLSIIGVIPFQTEGHRVDPSIHLTVLLWHGGQGSGKIQRKFLWTWSGEWAIHCQQGERVGENLLEKKEAGKPWTRKLFRRMWFESCPSELWRNSSDARSAGPNAM